MRSHSLRRRGPDNVLVATVGLGLGFVAGFLVRSLVGGMDRGRLRQVVRQIAGTPVAGPSARASAARIQQALDGAADFRDLGLEVLPSRPGHVELHGWVPSRAAGARALRVAASADPGTDVTSRLRVRGEDDRPPVLETGPDDAEERRPA
jgi:hypothetical protein